MVDQEPELSPVTDAEATPVAKEEVTIDDTLQRIFEEEEKIIQSREDRVAALKDPAYVKLVQKEIEKRKAAKKNKK